MGRINAKEAINKIAKREDFNAGNFWGKWDLYPDKDGLPRWTATKYVVYSYKQWIAEYDKESNSWKVNEQKYSMTTSKHQNYTKQGISLWQAVQGVVAINA